MNGKQRVAVTGGAGFIASHLQDALLERGCEVLSLDLAPAEKCPNIQHLLDDADFEYTVADCSDAECMKRILAECDTVFHLASNTDVRKSADDSAVDLEQTFLTTRAVLEGMTGNGIRNLFFSSSSAVYGSSDRPSVEDSPCRPISLYGAYKAASESLISAYSRLYDMNSLIIRFSNVIGPRSGHGVIYDFVRKLKKNPAMLEILGDGRQSKEYVHVSDAVSSIIHLMGCRTPGTSVYNVSSGTQIDVDSIGRLVCRRMGLDDVEFCHTGGESGWRGDIPRFSFDISKAGSAGWHPSMDSENAIIRTLEEMDLDSVPPMD